MADRYQNKAYSADNGYAQHPENQGAGGSDPLAELARLIGQSDPFNNFGRDARPAPSRDTSFMRQSHDEPQFDAEPPAQPAWMQRMRQRTESEAASQDHSYTEADDAHHQYEHLEALADTQPDPSRYDGVLFGSGTQDVREHADVAYRQDDAGQAEPHPWQDAYDPQYESEPAEKPRRGGLLTVAVVVALGVVGTAGAYAYRSFVGGARSGEAPVIRAETGPNKIVPPANQSPDGSKLIYDRIGQGAGGQERVVSREEQPLDVNAKSGARVVFPPLNQSNAQPSGAQAQRGATAPAAPAAGGQSEEPRKVRTLSIRPDQAEPAPAPAPAKPAARAAAAPPAANPSSAANASANSPVSLAPPPGQQQSQAEPRVRTASTAPSGGTGNYVVQVSSQRSEADAQASYRALQSKYPSVLGSRQAAIRRADLGDKGVYYRAIVGPFASSEDATQLCNSLKSAGGQCNIMRN